MSVTAPIRAVAPDSAGGGQPPATGRMIISLARVEGRRLLRHPMFLAGIALSVIVVLIGGDDSVPSTHSVIEPLWPAGFPIGPLAVFGFVVTNLAAMRDRLSGTEELFGSTALSHRARTAALLLSAAWAVAAGVVLLAPFVAVFAIAYGVSLADLVKLSEEPLIVAVLAVAGVALGRQLPTRVVGPVVAFFALLVMGAYAHPTVPGHFFGLWVVPDSLPSVGWHILYLAGLGICTATLALGKDGVRRSLVVAAALGVGAVVAGAILQLPVSCPGASPCVFR